MLFIYKFLTFFFYPIFILLIYFRKFLNKEDKIRFKEKIFKYKLNKRDLRKKLFWFHAASIGEIKSIIPLIKKIENSNVNAEFLLTTITLTSGNLVKKIFKKSLRVKHKYLPLDVNFLVKNFLNQWNPQMIIFVDSEIWPNFLLEIKKREIPLVLLNGRITKKTFLRWNLIPKIAEKIFQTFDLCLASSKESKKYLRKLKASKIKYLGNLKLSVQHNLDKLTFAKHKIFNKKKVWCALSTHSGEDMVCLKTHLILKKKYKNLISIIIPRNIDRSYSIASMCGQLKLKSQVLSSNEKIDKNKEIIIINEYGVVSNYLKFCKSVFIGKSLIKKLSSVGGQNPIEPAKFGCKIYHGPYVYNFQEIYKLFNKLKIASKIKNEFELSKKLMNDLNSSKKTKNKKIKNINILGNKILNKTYLELNKF